MPDADLDGVLHLFRSADEHLAQPAAAIEHAGPTSPWPPTSAPEIDAVS